MTQELKLSTPRQLHGILKELAPRESIFHRPEWGTTRAEIEVMTAEDFWAISASGRLYSRAYVIDAVAARYLANEPEAG